jgi:hypothetical protein
MNVSFGSIGGNKSGSSMKAAAGSPTGTASNDDDKQAKVDGYFSPMSDPTLSGSSKDIATPTHSNKKASSVKKFLGKLSSPFRSPPKASTSASSTIDLVDKKVQEHGHDPTKLNMVEKIKVYFEPESSDTAVPDLVQQHQDLLCGVVVRDVTSKKGNDSCNDSLNNWTSIEKPGTSIVEPTTLLEDSAGDSLPSDFDSLCSIGSSHAIGSTVHDATPTASVDTDRAVIHRNLVHPSEGEDRDEVLDWIVDFSKAAGVGRQTAVNRDG